MKDKKSITKWFYWFSLGVCIIAVFKILDNFSDITSFLSEFIGVLMPFIIAIIFAYLFYIPSKKLEGVIKKSKLLRKKARTISVLAVYIIAIVAIVFIIKGIIPSVVKSVTDLGESLPKYYNSFLETYDKLEDNSILKKVDMHKVVDKLKEIDITEFVKLSNIEQYINGAIGVVSTVFSILVSIIFSVYLLISRHDIKNFFVKLIRAVFPENTSKNILEYLGKTNKIFINFIYCQILDGIIIGIITSIALTILKVKYGILLGMMIGLLNIIPYFGAIIAIAIAAFITLFTGGFEKAIIMLIVTIILQQIDSNIINPHILGEGLKINPIVIIFAVTLGGAYFNVLGMFLAVPVAAIIKILLEDYIELKVQIRNSKRDKKIE